MEPQFNEKKFGELIVYLAMKCDDDVCFGATKLNKLLFYSDFAAYRALGAPITGAEYRALPFGPAPKELLPARERLVREKAIALQAFGNQHRVIALREPDLSVFSANEIAAVDLVLEKLADLDAGKISEISHAFLGWKAAMAECMAHPGRKVSIPYGTAFVSNRRLDDFERAGFLALCIKHGWAPSSVK